MDYKFRAFSKKSINAPITVDETYLDTEDIIWRGALDNGTDWFYRKLDFLEKDFKGQWDYAILTSSRGIEGNIVSRDHYLGISDKKLPETIVPMALLFSENPPTANFDQIYGDHLYSTTVLKEYPYWYDLERPFTFEHYMAMAFRFLELSTKEYDYDYSFSRLKSCSFVSHFNQNELIIAGTSGQFNVILNITSVSDALDIQEKLLQLDSLTTLKNNVAYQAKFLQSCKAGSFNLPLIVDQFDSQIGLLIDDIRSKYFPLLSL